MLKSRLLKGAAHGPAAAALLLGTLAPVAPVAAQGAEAPEAPSVRPTSDLTVSVGTGRMVRLDSAISDIFVANDGVADVQVRSANQIYVFGKAPGQTTVFATTKTGKVVYSANVRVGMNFETVDDLLRMAMPEAQITATPMNGAVLLTGTVAAPADVEEANRIVQAYVGEGTQVLSRLKTATPQQVMLRVKVAEVSRSLIRNIGVNLLTRDATSGFQFGIGRGSPGTIGGPFNNSEGTTTLGFAGNLLGLDILSTLDLSENSGLVTTLAEPRLTALSGETASFLAGGEFPIATSNGLNGTAVDFKSYGVSLAFTPFVLEGGRISMRVRPEVSEITTEGAIRLDGVDIPALITRRAETTVELGSGQSFMIGGLLRNNGGTTVEKAPWLGDIPILGSLFRSSGFRRNETELVIVVTPYLVNPVNASQIALPTDGFRLPHDAKRVLVDQRNSGVSGERAPMPRVVQPQTAAPGIGPVGAATDLPQAPAPAPVEQAQRAAIRPEASAGAKPGFSF